MTHWPSPILHRSFGQSNDRSIVVVIVDVLGVLDVDVVVVSVVVVVELVISSHRSYPLGHNSSSSDA